MALQCRSTVTWTECVAAAALEDGCVLPRLITTPRRMCGRNTTQYDGCDSAIFPTHGLQYSHVCGRVMGHQDGTPNAFTPFHDRDGG